jgi:hypothetical protein
LTLTIYAAAPLEAERSAADRLESRFFGETTSGVECGSDRAKIAPNRAKLDNPTVRRVGSQPRELDE